MSDFRLFCIGFLVGAFALIVSINHGAKVRPGIDSPAGVILAGLFIGALAVAIWGRK